MNDLVAAHLIKHAREGQHVMVLSHTQNAARHAFREIVDTDDDTARSRVTRANGKERIDYDIGGSITVRSVQGHGYRGYSADLVFVERDADEHLARDMYMDVLPLVATTNGRIVRE